MCRDACVTSLALQFALRIAGASIGVFLIVSSVSCFFKVCFTASVSAFVRNFHTGLFGLLVILAEVRWDYLLSGFAFLKSFTGRGLLYIYLATIVGTLIEGSDEKLYIVITIILLWIGFMNLFLGCCFRQVEMQSNASPSNPASSPADVRKNEPVAVGAHAIDNSV